MDAAEAWRWSIHISPVDGEVTDYHVPQMVDPAGGQLSLTYVGELKADENHPAVLRELAQIGGVARLGYRGNTITVDVPRLIPRGPFCDIQKFWKLSFVISEYSLST